MIEIDQIDHIQMRENQKDTLMIKIIEDPHHIIIDKMIIERGAAIRKMIVEIMITMITEGISAI